MLKQDTKKGNNSRDVRLEDRKLRAQARHEDRRQPAKREKSVGGTPGPEAQRKTKIQLAVRQVHRRSANGNLSRRYAGFQRGDGMSPALKSDANQGNNSRSVRIEDGTLGSKARRGIGGVIKHETRKECSPCEGTSQWVVPLAPRHSTKHKVSGRYAGCQRIIATSPDGTPGENDRSCNARSLRAPAKCYSKKRR